MPCPYCSAFGRDLFGDARTTPSGAVGRIPSRLAWPAAREPECRGHGPDDEPAWPVVFADDRRWASSPAHRHPAATGG